MVLVTGGTGFIGGRLVRALSGLGRPIRVLTRHVDRMSTFPPGTEVAVGDLLEPATLPGALDAVSVVIHLAAALAGRGSDDRAVFRTNVEGTRNLARAARASGVATFVYCSSASVYGDGSTQRPHGERDPTAPSSSYQRSKLEAERVLEQELGSSLVGWVVLRPPEVFGAGRPATLAFYRSVSRKAVWVHGPARLIVHPTYVDDVVSAILLVLDHTIPAGETFNIAGERPLVYQELIELVGRTLGRRVRQVALPAPVGAIARFLGNTSRRIGLDPPERLSRLARPVINRAVDTSKAQQWLGFRPTKLERGIESTVASFRSEGLL